MKIVICGSLDFSYEIKEVADKLKEMGHEVVIPLTSEKIIRGEVALEQIREEKEDGRISERAIKLDVVRSYYNKIKEAEAVLVLNLDKKGIEGYIGGATLMEIGFAHVLDKKLFLYKKIPEMNYSSEVRMCKPIVISQDLTKII